MEEKPKKRKNKELTRSADRLGGQRSRIKAVVFTCKLSAFASLLLPVPLVPLPPHKRPELHKSRNLMKGPTRAVVGGHKVRSELKRFANL